MYRFKRRPHFAAMKFVIQILEWDRPHREIDEFSRKTLVFVVT